MHKTIVLNGAGPHVRVRLASQTGSVRVMSNSKAKNIHLGKSTDLKFSAA